MHTLLKTSSDQKWTPRSIDSYRNNLIIPTSLEDNYSYKSNFAYNIQYIEYIEKQLKELRLTDPLMKMLCKTYVLTGISIIELLFSSYLKGNNLIPKQDWIEICKTTSQEKTVSEKKFRSETKLFLQVEDYPKNTTFDSMVKHIEKKGLLSIDHEIFGKLNHLRKIRNKVHLQEIRFSFDHDYNTFTPNELNNIRVVLYAIVTCSEFCRNPKLFDFIYRSVNEPETVK